MRRLLAWIVAAALAAFLAALAWAAGMSASGYFAPVFSPDGQFVYYVTRESRGFMLGVGIEFFTPAAPVYILRDRFALWRAPFAGGAPERLIEFPVSPLEGTWISTWRGRAFSIASVFVQPGASGVRFTVSVTRPTQPSSETWVVNDTHQDWRKEWPGMSGFSDDAVWGDWELIAAPGPETYPCAIVGRNFVTLEMRPVVRTPACQALGWDRLEALSRRADVLRVREMGSTRERLIEERRRQGLSEGDAVLSADRELERLGFYPRTPKWIARDITGSPSDAVAFDISEDEFRGGVFQDLERAIASPGEEVETGGTYIRMQGHDTSEKLNRFLRDGGTVFQIRRGDKTYEIRLLR